MRLPKISIVTVVYNDRDALEKTLESVAAQDYSNIESIIIDGGSNDGTLEVIKKYHAIIAYWVSEPDNGIYEAMNKGMNMANGEYITFLNAGDCYTQADVITNLFTNNNHEDIVYGDIFVVNAFNDKPPRYQKARPFNKDKLLKYGTAVVCHQAIFVKKSISPQYNLKYKYKAELNWYFDLVEANDNLSYEHINIPVVYYALGGYGYVNFVSNLLEWCQLIINRYGLWVFFKYNYPMIIIQKLKNRYS
jgi:glycosyltransferase involved in cell wall biosynthesis